MRVCIDSHAFVGMVAETLAPGQGEQLIRMSEQRTCHAATTIDDQQSQQSVNNEMVENLKRLYDLYVKQKMPFNEQVRLISLLPRSWSYAKIMEIFECSRYAVVTAHSMYDDEQYLLTRDNNNNNNNSNNSSIRQRATHARVKHFVSWLVESNSLVSGKKKMMMMNVIHSFVAHRHVRS